MNPIQRVIVKKRPDDVNVVKSSKSQTVCHVQLVILVIQIVVHANVISMVRMAISVNHQMGNVHANRTLPATFVNVVMMDFTDPNVCHAIVIQPVHLIVIAM